MPARRRPSRDSLDGSALVLLEEMRSQNRAVMEAVDTMGQSLRAEMRQMREELNARFEVLEAAVRQNSADIRQLRLETESLKERLTRVETVLSDEYRDRLHNLERRVEALEHRPA